MMFVPAAFLSAWMLPLGCFLLFEAIRAVALNHDSKMLLVSSLWATSLFRLACCDAALINEGFKLKLFLRVNSYDWREIPIALTDLPTGRFVRSEA
jgi:hypothetical protein